MNSLLTVIFLVFLYNPLYNIEDIKMSGVYRIVTPMNGYQSRIYEVHHVQKHELYEDHFVRYCAK